MQWNGRISRGSWQLSFKTGNIKCFLPQRQWWQIYKISRHPIHSLSNTKIFWCHRSSKTINSELCEAIDSFSLQKTVTGVSGEESLVSVKETSKKMAIWNKVKEVFKEG
jgi:hypothetical protein